MNPTSDEVGLLERARTGDSTAWEQLISRHRDRLKRMIEVRLDDRLRGRVDPSDVIQEALVEVVARLPEYLAQPPMPFFLWLRLTVGQQLVNLHRHHLGAEKRDASREQPLAGPAVSSAALAVRLRADGPSPSEAVERNEEARRLREAVESLDPLDREIVSLRHFEHLDRAEAARALGISEAAAAKRHLRALKRLREAMDGRRDQEIGDRGREGSGDRG